MPAAPQTDLNDQTDQPDQPDESGKATEPGQPDVATEPGQPDVATEGTEPDEPAPVLVRFWASARAVAGRSELTLPASPQMTLADLLDQVAAALPGADRLPQVLAVCSVLVGETPHARRDHGDVPIRGGDVVELLPPFAGG